MSISKQKTALFFRLSISLTVFSALFKFMPSFLIIVGALGMVIFLSLQLYQKEQRSPLDYARLLLIIAFASNYTCLLFAFPYESVMTLITKLALITFLILYIRDIIMALQDFAQNTTLLLSGFSKEQLSFVLADLATVYIVIASLFTILHWEIGILNANLLLAIGLFSALISILASSKQLEK